MLYSEKKERENRFILALKISLPFLALIFIALYYFNKYEVGEGKILLLVFLSLIYVYYIVYQIYNAFDKSFIDPISKAFNRKMIVKYIKNEIAKQSNKNVLMIEAVNIYDINERYGAYTGDKILEKFIKEFENFLIENKILNTPIGKYSGSHFVAIINMKETELQHLVGIFERKTTNVGIDGIELKIKFKIENIKNYKTSRSIILNLQKSLKDEEKNIENLNPEEFETLVCKLIDKGKVYFKYQAFVSSDTDEKLYEVFIRLYSKQLGNIAYSRISPIANRNGYEIKLDEQIVKKLVKELSFFKDKNVKFILNISPVSLRNNHFKELLIYAIKENGFNAKNFILEFDETKTYSEINRFCEILNSYKKEGFLFALKHFGGNNASLEYLKLLPIDYINFDIEYTKNIQNNKIFTIMKGFIQSAKLLNIKTLIKFIQKEEDLELVKQAKIDFMQGYKIQKDKNIIQLEKEFS